MTVLMVAPCFVPALSYRAGGSHVTSRRNLFSLQTHMPAFCPVLARVNYTDSLQFL